MAQLRQANTMRGASPAGYEIWLQLTRIPLEVTACWVSLESSQEWRADP